MTAWSFPKESTIPQHTKEGFERYFKYGYEPGSFGMAVLENNFVLATQKADLSNRAALTEIAHWLEENAPRGSWGSPKVVQGWLNKNKYFQDYQKELTFQILSEE